MMKQELDKKGAIAELQNEAEKLRAQICADLLRLACIETVLRELKEPGLPNHAPPIAA